MMSLPTLLTQLSLKLAAAAAAAIATVKGFVTSFITWSYNDLMK
jgi:hypothetical protein